MTQLIPNTETYIVPPSGDTPAPAPTREPVRVILIGSLVGINLIIKTSTDWVLPRLRCGARLSLIP
jgi:hypothetical protein